ncbi:MAG: sel1 repeat family protein [Bacteroidales bacterium]|jgi:TPR repeat protein|nr:sel1 repeat family protein [Bacteroidales bacterium]
MKNRYLLIIAVCFVVFLCGNTVSQAQNLERKAKRGNVQAQYELAGQYYSGIGQLKNYKQALSWYEKASKGGNVDAMYCVARMQEEGKGCDTNVRNAFNNYLKAAERGNIPSQIRVAVMYEQGRGVMQSDARAYLWYRVCADRENVLACRKLGDYYAEGRVVEKDHSEARYWYEKAINASPSAEVLKESDKQMNNSANVAKTDTLCLNGYYEEQATAMENLAGIYTADAGIAPNPKKAEELLEKAKALRNRINK